MHNVQPRFILTCLASSEMDSAFMSRRSPSTPSPQARAQTSSVKSVPTPPQDSGPNHASLTMATRKADFFIVPIPRRLRYDPSRQHHFGVLLQAVFCITSTFGTHYSAFPGTLRFDRLTVVAYVCYCQPIQSVSATILRLNVV